MKIFQFFAASALAQELDNANWSCDFAYDLDNLTSPPSENARFISSAVADVSESSINMYMTTDAMAAVCQGSIAAMRSEAGRADTPSWFWTEQQEDGRYSVRYCCEPAAYKNPVDELMRIIGHGEAATDFEDALDVLQGKMVSDYRKKRNNGDALTDAIEFPFSYSEGSGCDRIAEFAQVLKNWSSVHNINYTTGNNRRHKKFIREIDEAFLPFTNAC